MWKDVYRIGIPISYKRMRMVLLTSGFGDGTIVTTRPGWKIFHICVSLNLYNNVFKLACTKTGIYWI